jgi:S1-C subfamily serine protease
MVLNVARNLIERGEVPRGMLGLFPTDLNREMADAFGLDSTRGALVNQVQTDSPAARAGIVHGDIITRINETEIESAAQLRLVVSQILPGTEVDVTLVRRGSTKVVPVTLGSLGGGFAMGSDGPLPGVELETLNDEIRDALGVPDGLEGVAIRSISEDSTFYDKLEASMIILEVNGRQVTSVEDIADNLKEGQNYLYVFADGNMGFVVFKM